MASQKDYLTLSTRPAADAARDVAALARRNVPAKAMPVMALVPCPLSILPDHRAISALIFTSRNAVTCFAASVAMIPWQDKPVFVVGAATGIAARQVGFRHIEVGAGGGSGLVPKILVAARDRARNKIHDRNLDILWLSPVHKSFDMQAALGAYDIGVIDFPVYDMEPVGVLDPVVAANLVDGGGLSVILMSARSANLFVELLKAGNLWHHRFRISVIAGSAAIAMAAGDGWQKVWVSKRPVRSRVLAIATLLHKRGIHKRVGQREENR